jgi:hypothetical protein
MKVQFETVVDGINRYLSDKIYINLNELQEFAVRVIVGRVTDNVDLFKNTLMGNPVARFFCYMDEDGMVDVDAFAMKLKQELDKKGKLRFSIPFISKLTFIPSDADVLKNYMSGR